MRSAKTSVGIENFTTQDKTYDKWVLSRPFQAKYVKALFEMIGMAGKDSNRKTLRQSEISKSEKRITSLKKVLTDTFIDPFSDDLDADKLYNIMSGSPVDEEVSRCLLTIEERGRVLHSEFDIRLCSNQGPEKTTFWNPIKMVEWKDFSGNETKTKLKSSTGKTKEAAVQRVILGFLLAKS